MKKIAYIFPGQGAQYVGMGRDVYKKFKEAKDIFDRAEEVLGRDIAALCFDGPAEELVKTDNSQVAIFTLSIAIMRTLRSLGRDELSHPALTAGLSLGEYSALVASGVLDFEEGLRLVSARGRFMQEAAEKEAGGMLAIIGLSLEDVERVCGESGCEVANLNCPNQVVVSGGNKSLEIAKSKASASGAKKVIMLEVSGAFHSSLMKDAGERLLKEMGSIAFKTAQIPVVSNVTAKPVSLPDEIKENLIKQVSSATRWEDSMNFMKSEGVNRYLEIGPGKVLKGLARKIDAALAVETVGTVEEIELVVSDR
ncbi:MAG: [acyl-carrier-protein] S-malonyltransferase [Candidatus Omnitrophica bacterium CG1_02_49_10]|nr:MAG: [acyl-carrier-protein] S-malonyltransferase [Candidatus Omnitrophica bacterium CG1_02_49_10]